MTHLRVLAGFVLLAGGSVPAAGAQSAPLSVDEIRRVDSIFARFDGTNRPGCAVGVGRGGAQVYARGYGMADLQNEVPIGLNSTFHVASVSKQFAAFAVALLAEDGRLSLDDEVRKHVPELPDYGKTITIRHLIYHTSGVRDQWELLGLAGWRYPDDLFTQDDVLEIVKRQKALNFAPGDEYLYSNAGYTLLAIIASRVSGKSLRDFSEERIFRPLGMTRTHVHDDHAMIVPGRTSAYQRGPKGWRISVPVFDTHGATSLFTTVEDLLKWEHNFETATVGSRALLKEAETSALLNDGRPANYGFGISTGTYRGTPSFGHGGADAGYRADVVRFPEHRLAVAVTCNFADAVPGSYARAVADVLIGDKLAPVATPPKGVEVAAARLEQLAGVYKSSRSDQAMVVAFRGGRLYPRNGTTPIEALDESRLRLGPNVGVFGPAGGAPRYLRLTQDDRLVDSMVRMPAFTPDRAALAAYLGDYWSDELRVSYRIEQGDSGLVVRMFKHGQFPLSPLYQDTFVAQRPGTVHFLRTKGRVTGFRVTGGRVRNVEFVKGSDRP